MAGQHTPGPWAVHPQAAYVVPAEHIGRKLGGAEDLAYDLATYAQEICAMHHPDPHRSEAEVRANARLIAAAPELLAALKGAVEIWDRHYDKFQLDAAVEDDEFGPMQVARAAIAKAEARA